MCAWEEDHIDKSSVSSHPIKGTCYKRCQHDIIVDVDLSHLAEVVLVHFSTVKFFLFPTPLSSVEGSYYGKSTFTWWGVRLCLLEVRIPPEILWISLW
jgi:hypothetical protein